MRIYWGGGSNVGVEAPTPVASRFDGKKNQEELRKAKDATPGHFAELQGLKPRFTAIHAGTKVPAS
jgi:hypothetical protein